MVIQVIWTHAILKRANNCSGVNVENVRHGLTTGYRSPGVILSIRHNIRESAVGAGATAYQGASCFFADSFCWNMPVVFVSVWDENEETRISK